MPTNQGWEKSKASGSTGWTYGYGPDMFSIYWYPIYNPNNTVIAISNDDVCFCDMSADYLISPFLKLTGGYSNITLQFSAFYTGDYGSLGYVKVSTNGTLNNLQSLITMPIGNPPNYGWSQYNIDLSSYVNDTIRLVFFHNDGGGDGTGFAVDNIYVFGSTLIQPLSISGSVSNYNGYSVTCNGGNNGYVNITVTGGVIPYNYHWSTGATSEDISNLHSGSYTVTVNSFNGSVATATYVLTQPAQITKSANLTNPNFYGGNNGSITLTVNGGVSPYSFLWSNGSITKNIYGLTAGVYIVTITDSNGCTATASYTLIQPPPLYYNVPFTENFEGMPTNLGWTNSQASGSNGWLYGYGPDMFSIYWYHDPVNKDRKSVV